MARTLTFTCSTIETLPTPALLDDLSHAQITAAYHTCRMIAQHYGRTFYLGSLLLPPPKRKAIWALYAFCRYADDLVDNSLDHTATHAKLDDWEDQLLQATCQGIVSHPILAAWTDTARRYPLPLDAARDLLSGLRMDLQINRYACFDDLRLYCYRVASTVGLLSSAVIGYCDPVALNYAVDLGIAMQLTNILRDIGEDSRKNYIYLPQEELDHFGYSEAQLMNGEITASFVRLMDFQIERARQYYRRAAYGIKLLNADGRLSIMTSMLLYGKILDQIERNNYEVFRKRAHLSMVAKISHLPVAVYKLWQLERFTHSDLKG